MEKIKIGILEFGIRKNLNALSKVEDILNYACLADQLGFSRFWLSEHYTANYDAAWQNPEPLLPLLAGMTNNISIGVAGLLIKYHVPYRVALNFKLLANLFPGRIDLGFAKGSPSVKNAIPLLFNGCMEQESRLFQDNLSHTIRLMKNEEQYAEKNIIVSPYKGDLPNFWALSVSNNGLSYALENGLNYSRSLSHQNANTLFEKGKLQSFIKRFEDTYGKKPFTNLAIASYCASDSVSAERDFKSLLLENPYFLPFENNESAYVFGNPRQFADRLSSLSEAYGVDEFILIDIANVSETRMESLHLISEACGLLQTDRVVATI